MSDLKAKMHRIRFPPGLCPISGSGGYRSAPDGPIAVCEGPTSKGRDGKRRGWRRGGEGGKGTRGDEGGMGREGRECDGAREKREVYGPL